MKNLILVILSLFVIQNTFASHIIGGTITYEYLGDDNYKIKLEVLRDCYNGNPNAWFDNPASIGIFDAENTLVNVLSIELTSINDTISFDIPNNICVFPPSVCVHKTNYEAIVNLPPITGGYTLAYQRCCRTVSMTNIINPIDIGMTFHTHIDPSDQNNSPIFSQNFPFAVFVGTPFIYDGSAIDIDGDSLVYELSHPFLGASPDDPIPQPPLPPPYDTVAFVSPPYSVENMLGGNHPLTINSETGEITAIPSTLGIFQIAYKVKEYRNDELIGTTYREFAFIVTLADFNQNFDISGKVIVDNFNFLDIGKVQILERDIATDSLFLYEEQSISNGNYSFENIPPGVFYTKAIVDSTSIYYDNYLPTYYNQAPFWYNADALNQCDTSQINRDIHLIHVDSLMGLIDLDGYVYFENTNIPVSNFDFLIGLNATSPLQARNTNEDGYFKFENLEPETYSLFADLINSKIDNSNPPSIDLNESQTIRVNLYNDSLSIESITNLTNIQKATNYQISIFPTPTSDKVSLNFQLTQSEEITIQLYDLLSNRIEVISNNFYSEGFHNLVIDLNDYPKGAYFIEFLGKRGKEIKKIIKQ